jgi:hypothetical protein
MLNTRLEDEREWILAVGFDRNFSMSMNDAEFIAKHFLQEVEAIYTEWDRLYKNSNYSQEMIVIEFNRFIKNHQNK